MATNPAQSTPTQPRAIRRKRIAPPPKTRIELVQEFDRLPLAALAIQAQVAAFLNCSEAKLERDRWAGGGIAYHKVGRQVRYAKADVVAYVAQQHRTSTTDTGRTA